MAASVFAMPSEFDFVLSEACDASAKEYVVDLADAVNWNSAIVQLVEQHALRRRNSVVVPVCSPYIGAGSSDEGPCDHATHFMLALQYFARDLTYAVEFVDRDDVFMRGDLKDAVG